MLNGLCCRTINSDYDQTNFSVIPASGTAALSIQCAELVGHESRLAARSLHHLAGLSYLRISHCNLTALPRDSLAGLQLLAKLSVHTLHTHPEAKALAGLRRLSRLDLSYGLWRLPDQELCGLQSLIHLNLSHNSFKDVKDAGLGGEQSALSSLASLDLSHNQLQQVPGLRVLILSNNQISQVNDGGLDGLLDIKTLDLSGNKIISFPSQCEDLAKELY